MKPDPQREESLFSAAREIADPEARLAYLQRECAGNPELLNRVQRLLDLAEDAKSIFPSDTGPETLATIATPISEGPGDVIGRYKLLQKIGEGGFGVVFMAEQQEPVRRKVAFKVIKLGMDTKQVVARFEAERQALALMDHPNIARVFDGGSTESGRIFFAMELVRGVPITRFCDENQLTTKERLGLFTQVCQAVQHAHQKGIIHRDIKPSNILVTLDYGQPTPKVIDFGIAKATQQRLTEKTLFTQFAQMIGTPAYMSPEQAEMSSLDIDTRTDVYSLGVLLYELLTGTTPISEEKLRSAGYGEMQRLIREVDPERPSTRVSTLQDAERKRLAKHRGGETASLGKLIKGDLDWIVMKAIEKDRRRRYDTPNELAADVTRHLNNEAVTATPPSLAYKFQKFAKRNRTAVTAGLAIAATLILGICISTWQAIRANNAEREIAALLESEKQARAEGEAERDRANANAEEALRLKEETDAINRWLIMDFIGQGYSRNAESSQGRGAANLALIDALVTASASMGKRFKDQPAVEGNIRLVVARALQSLERKEEAVAYYRQAYQLLHDSCGMAHTNTLIAQNELGFLLSWMNLDLSGEEEKRRREEGRKLMEHSYQIARASLGIEDPVTLLIGVDLGVHYLNEGDAGLAECVVPELAAVAERNHADDGFVSKTPRQATHFALGYLRSRQGRYAEERKLLDQRLQWHAVHAPRSIEHAEDLSIRGRYYWWWDRDYNQAMEALTKGLNLSVDLAGDGYPTQNLLAELHSLSLHQGDFSAALEYQRRLHDIDFRRLGNTHQGTRSSGRDIVAIPGRQGDWRAAATELRSQRERGVSDALSICEEMLALQLDGQSHAAKALWQQFWNFARDNRAESPDFRSTLIVLILSTSEAELPQVLDLAKRAESSPRDSSWHWAQASLLRGLSDYRLGQLSESAHLLRPVAHNLDNRRLAVLARYFMAMALKHQAQEDKARSYLNDANDLLNRLLRGGTLDPEFPDTESWSTYACCLLARDEAETLVLGEPVSTLVTKESLALAREAWKPVRELLVEVQETARRQEYHAARDLYLRVREHPNFELEAAFEYTPWMIERMPAIFAQAGDQEGFVRFLEEAYREEGLLPINYLVPLAYADWHLPEKLRQRIESSTLTWTGTEADIPANLKAQDYWRLRQLGMALYRLGQHDEALRFLEPATQCHYHDCSISAKAYAGLAAWKLGRKEEAKRWLGEAAEGLRIRVEAGEGKLDPSWWHMAATDLALQEAKTLLGDSFPKAAVVQQRQP